MGLAVAVTFCLAGYFLSSHTQIKDICFIVQLSWLDSSIFVCHLLGTLCSRIHAASRKKHRPTICGCISWQISKPDLVHFPSVLCWDQIYDKLSRIAPRLSRVPALQHEFTHNTVLFAVMSAARDMKQEESEEKLKSILIASNSSASTFHDFIFLFE